MPEVMDVSRIRVAIVGGARTSGVKAGNAFPGVGSLALVKHAVQGLFERHDLGPQAIEAVTQMARQDADYGLIGICAAGAMAGAFVLERS